MKSISSLASLLIICALSVSTYPCFAENGIGFFYIVLQWPGSYCNTKQGCCYPKNGKPANDFSIGGLWPFYFNGTFPTYCNPHSSFNLSKISDLTKIMQQNWPSLACPRSDSKSLWSREWQKYGTCSESLLNQHQYFEAALNLKEKIHLLKILN
ncbi:extracellular ribonuclease LE-like [Cornus florida]|uniref:extracellular ribonuclease LE-like n=1 Tax=Cornus florida TaxID=4283 RepID=UPI00289F79B7|nr:extracellular ribonuclease LE-like [Cornus florida]